MFSEGDNKYNCEGCLFIKIDINATCNILQLIYRPSNADCKSRESDFSDKQIEL